MNELCIPITAAAAVFWIMCVINILCARRANISPFARHECNLAAAIDAVLAAILTVLLFV